MGGKKSGSRKKTSSGGGRGDNVGGGGDGDGTFTECARGHMRDVRASDMASATLLTEQMSSLPLAQQRAIIRSRLIDEMGTDCGANDTDPTGDGDQSPIQTADGRQAAREVWSTGGDIATHFLTPGALSDFAMSCITGDVRRVRAMLESEASKELPPKSEDGAAPGPSQGLINLLEARETSMRLSPLLMAVACAKNVGVDNADVVRLLLRYGARPDAKDVVGRTVCHYGAGQMATPMTLEACDMCMRAARTAHLFGKDVALHGLRDGALNGSRGIALGYLADNDRRSVFLSEGGKVVAVKPENIKLVVTGNADKKEAAQPLMLVDLQDRLGNVCLQEVIVSQREDVARYLLEKHCASIDIVDMDGLSPRKMCTAPGAAAMSSVVPIIMKLATARERAPREEKMKRCDKCGTPESEGVKLRFCSKCWSVRYCGRKCALAAWKDGHRGVCNNLAEGIKLDPPLGPAKYAATVAVGTGKMSMGGSYRSPDGVAVGERFYVKVQATAADTLLLVVYDRTRQCSFVISQGQAGYNEILNKVREQHAYDGRKSYFRASFDAEGNCTIFPSSSTLKHW